MIYRKFHATETTTCRCTICHTIVDFRAYPTGPFCSLAHFENWKKKLRHAITEEGTCRGYQLTTQARAVIQTGEIPWAFAHALQGL